MKSARSISTSSVCCLVAFVVSGCSDDGTAAPADTEASGSATTIWMGSASAGGSAPDSGAATTQNTSSSDGGDTSGTSSDDGPSEGTGTDAGWWRPATGITWQWQLTESIDESFGVDAYDIDLFDVSADVIASLHAEGRVVICYFSAGSYEDWRPDADDFPMPALGMQLDEWPGEFWVDHRDAGVRAVMAARLDLAVQKECDAVEPDNVDGYANSTGFDFQGPDQIDYNLWLADEAHARGLSVGLKNDVDQVLDLVDAFDWALNEECVAYSECDTMEPFIDAGKPVLHVEYVDDQADGPALADQVCPDANARSFSTLIKGWDLDPWVIACM